MQMVIKAPMYYRGANAALLLYDITNASTFNDIRGWLEGIYFPLVFMFLSFHKRLICAELRKNCPPELIIFIVGSKADLHQHREVTSDLARLSLHTWFPPPRPPTPPPPQSSTALSYMRPRFTSFTSIRSVPLTTNKSSSPDRLPQLDSSPNLGAALKRTSTGPGLTRPNTTSSSRSITGAGIRSRSPQSRFSAHFGAQAVGWNEIAESSSNSYNDDEDTLDVDDQEWGLNKGMELFEVSAKDDSGLCSD